MVGHPDAPLVGQVDDASLFVEAVKAVQTPSSGWNGEDVALIRNAALGNLYFFLKYVAGYTGPYSKLKHDLHMEMCNWRQDALVPGSWSAGFCPRSTYKSSVWTHGPIAWELLRNPDLRVGIFSCILDRSLEFMHSVQRTFDSNDLVEFLFPAHYVKQKKSRDGRWNDLSATMPNRTRNYPEPSLKAHTAGGSTQGIHVDLAVFDDIVGDSQLNSARQATAEMQRIANWFSSNLYTLLVSKTESRVTLAATRYSVDDPYESVMCDARTHDGDWQEIENHYPEAGPKGAWRVYYRSALVDGESIFPESYTVESLAELARKDHWAYVTQYVNNPHNAGTLDFSAYSLRECDLDWDREGGPALVLMRNGVEVERKLWECDLVLGVDPSASAKRVSVKTSRSAMALIARTPCDELVVVEAKRDYVKPSMLFNWLFNVHSKYRGKVRQFRVETQGPFKMLEDMIRDEMKRRGEWFYLVPVPAMGDKVPTIKLALEPFLKRDCVYVTQEALPSVKQEFDIFPSSMLDLLDAIKIGVAGTRLPDGAWARQDEDEDDDNRSEFAKRRVGVTGY